MTEEPRNKSLEIEIKRSVIADGCNGADKLELVIAFVIRIKRRNLQRIHLTFFNLLQLYHKFLKKARPALQKHRSDMTKYNYLTIYFTKSTQRTCRYRL